MGAVPGNDDDLREESDRGGVRVWLGRRRCGGHSQGRLGFRREA